MPNFVSPGGMASNAIEQFLMQRELQQQQEMEAQFRRQQAEQAQQRQTQELALRQTQEANDQAERQRVAQRQTGLDERAATTQRGEQNQLGIRQMLGDAMTQRGDQMGGLAMQAGITLPKPPGDPQAELTEYEAKKKIDARYREPSQPKDERLVQVMGPQGTPIWVRESNAVGQPAAQAARAVTGQERQALAFFNRAKDSSDTIARPDASGTSLEDRVSKAGLATQLGLQYAPNLVQSADQQAYRQAQRAFTEARLRKESGAAIPVPEYENDARTYFAQPGDDPATVNQKRAARQVVLDGLKFGSGKAYNEFYGDEAGAPKAPTSSAPVQKWGRGPDGRPMRLP